ncbi:MAG TPA: hypothetical protein VEK08_17750 [Planctomycetota bacterium]|nr:hypothetical protein [Planctomycetota bacterium]
MMNVSKLKAHRPICRILLCFYFLLCGLASVAGEIDLLPPLTLDKAGEKDKDGDKKDKDKEKEKEPEFKYSAWSAFRDLASTRPPGKVDPKSEESRPGSSMWSGFARRGQWVTIVLELKNTTEKKDFKGTASINLNPLRMTEKGTIPYTTTYRQDFEIGPQSTKQYTFSVLYPENGFFDKDNTGIPVQITANGGSYQRFVTLQDLDSASTDFIVVVSEKSGAFRGLMSIPNKVMERNNSGRIVAVVEPRDLPSRWHDLTMANLIIIDGPPTGEQIKEEQWAALKSYVQAGGHVLISAGKNPAALKSTDTSRERSYLEELAGITVKQTSEVQELNGGESRDLHLKLRNDVKLSMIDVTVNPEGTTIVQRNQPTQLVERCTRFYGFGTVTFLPYSLSDPVLPDSWEGKTSIPVSIVERSRGRTLFQNKSLDDENRPVRDPWGNTIQQALPASTFNGLRHALDESFAKDTPVKMQDPSFVLSFLLFYLLLAVPGNYFIFGWFKRREIAWLAVPVWAGSFSVLAYTISYMGQTGQLTVNQVSVIEAGSGQNVGMARSFVGIYAPRRDNYRVVFPTVSPVVPGRPMFDSQAAPGHLINIESQTGSLDSVSDLRLVDSNGTLSIERLLVQQRSTRRLEVLHRARLGDGLKVKLLRDEGNRISIEVENNTGYTLYSPVLIHEGKAIELGASAGNVLAPGASKNISDVGPNSAERKDINQAFFGKAVFLPATTGGHARKRAEALNEYIRSNLGTRSVVCAWLDNAEGSLPVLIGGSSGQPSRPKVEGMTMLLVPVNARSSGTSAGVLDKIKVRQSPDFNQNTQQATWLDVSSAGTPLRIDTINKFPGLQPAPHLTQYLSVELPSRYRELSDEGLRLYLKGKLEVTVVGLNLQAGTNAPNVSGTLAVNIRRYNDKGPEGWFEQSNELMLELKSGIAQSFAPVSLPLDSRHVNDNTMVLKLTFTPDTTNTAVRITNIKAQLKMLECRMSRGEGNQQ